MNAKQLPLLVILAVLVITFSGFVLPYRAGFEIIAVGFIGCSAFMFTALGGWWVLQSWTPMKVNH